MAGLIGWLIGSLIGSFLVYSILHWAIFKRIASDRLASHVLAAIATYPASATLYGFGAADNGEFRFDGFISYLLPSLIILAFAFKTGRGERQKADEEAQGAVFQ